MHATQPQGGACPEPQPAPEHAPADVAGLFTDEDRFRSWVGQAAATAAQPPAMPDQPDLKATGQEEFSHWAQGPTPSGAPASPTPTEGDGYLVTDAGLVALAGLSAQDVHADIRDVRGPAEVGAAPGTVSRLLRSAARYLERYGWIQGAYYEFTAECFTPAACLVGAIGMVCYGGPADGAIWSPKPGAVTGAVFWPVALFVATEILTRVAWPSGRV